jgi:hypothetical protein
LITFEVTGLDEVLQHFGNPIAPHIQHASMMIAEELKAYLVAEPKQRQSGPVQWASARQRRWWHWARRQAGLPLEYTRHSDPWSQDIQAKWAVKTDGPLGAIVGTEVTYAGWVVSAERNGLGQIQQPMHAATGWTTDRSAVEQLQQSGAADKILAQAVADFVKKLEG